VGGRFGIEDGTQNRRGEAVPRADTLEATDTPLREIYLHQAPAICPAPQPRVGEHNGADGTVPASPRWYALWTRSHCERLVWEQLTAGGFQAFLPTIQAWSTRGGVRHRIPVPMFPGYLFLHHNGMDRANYIEVRKARGLVSVLGERWDRLAEIPKGEIEAIQTVLQARVLVWPHTYLCEGCRVRITHGPLADVEGVLVQQKLDKGLLVLSVELLRRSVAIEVDCACVVPA
jgi:transcription termination/antitermination protein NusG